MMLIELADVLRRGGVRVEEVPGWKTRGHGPQSTVSSIVVHHSAGPASGESPSLRVIRDGRADLPGPLSHFLVGRSGTWYVNAAGLCWHAGPTFEPWQANAHSLGIEAEGTGRDTWPADQYRSLVTGVSALRLHFAVPVARILGHKEVAKPRGRKIDPNFDMPGFRAALLTPTTPVSPGSGGLPVLKRGDTGKAVERIQRWLGVVGPGDPGFGTFGPATEAKVRAYQQMRGIEVDGVVGPATYREMGLQ